MSRQSITMNHLIACDPMIGFPRVPLEGIRPEAEGGAALASLTYADITDTDRDTIAHGTIERLLSETAKEPAPPCG